jgi:Zn-finger nucleic acid-binding protein
MMFVGAKFCSHCGSRAERTEVPGAPRQRCPRCRVDLQAVVVGTTGLRECPRCDGIWADVDSLKQICADRERQSAVLGAPGMVPEPKDRTPEVVRYVPCPVCKTLMNRIQFARCSQVIVDVCKQHGTWFDKDELSRIVEFIRNGGLDKAREKEIRDLEESRRAAHSIETRGGYDLPSPSFGSYSTNPDLWDLGISAAAVFLKSLFK